MTRTDIKSTGEYISAVLTTHSRVLKYFCGENAGPPEAFDPNRLATPRLMRAGNGFRTQQPE